MLTKTNPEAPQSTQTKNTGLSFKPILLTILAVSLAFTGWALLAHLQPVEARQAAETSSTDGGVISIWFTEYVTGTVGSRYFVDMTGRSLAYFTDVGHSVQKLHLAYGGNALYYASSTWISPTWGAWVATVVDPNPGVGRYASIAVDNTNNAHIAYYDAANGCLKYAVQQAGFWFYEAVDCDNTPLPVGEPDNAASILTEDGETLISGTVVPRGPITKVPDRTAEGAAQAPAAMLSDPLNALAPTDQTNSTLAEPDAGVGQYTSIAVDMYGRPHISYTKFYPRPDGGGYINTYHKLKYAYLDSDGWHIYRITEAADASLDEGQFTSIALETRGSDIYPHIAFLDDTHDKVRYAFIRAYKDDNSAYWQFSYPTPDGIGHYDNLGGWNSLLLLAAEPRDRARIAFYDQTHGRLQIAEGTYNIGDKNYEWLLRTVDDSGDTGLFASLALVPGTSTLGVSYFDETKDDLRYATGSGTSWNTTLVTGTLSQAGRYTSLVYDYKKIPHITYFDTTNGNMYETTYTNTKKIKWIFRNIDISYDTGIASVLDLDLSNRPYILYYNESLRAVELAQRTPPWSAETVTTTRLTTNKNIGFKIDPNTGRFHAAMYDSVNKDLIYATKGGLFWNYTHVDTAGDVGQNPSLALDSAGNPFISYYDATNGNLKLAYYDGATWTVEAVDATPNDTGLYSSIAVDPASGQIYIAYFNATSSRLWIAYSNATTPHTFILTNVDNTADTGRFLSLDLTAGSIPGIAYYDASNQDLKYAIASAPAPVWTFTLTQVDTTGAVGKYCSLAFDHWSLPHISYYDETNGNLKYAYYDGSTWTPQTVDSNGDVGLWTSIAIEQSPSNVPHISYYDRTQGKMKYTYDPPKPITSVIYLPLLFK
jgi:hypothetical protein